MSRNGTTAESPNLDFLRAIAVLAVYYVHPRIMLGAKPGMMGLFGVLLFFVHTSLVLMMSLGVIRRRLPFIGWPLVIAAAGCVFAYGSAMGFYGASS